MQVGILANSAEGVTRFVQATLHFEFDTLRVPQHYNHTLQAFVLSLLDKNYASFLHDRGYEHENRVYKLFSFSKLYGDFERDETRNELVYKNRARLYVTCVDDEFFRYVMEKALGSTGLYINKQPIVVTRISFTEKQFDKFDEVTVNAVSPITVHTTVRTPDGRKFTKYYSPYEPEFTSSLVQNLKNKYRAFYRCNPTGEIEITPFLKTMRKAVIRYKKILIVGWKGLLKLKGSGELIKFALDVGLGAKTAEGFGCILVFSNDGELDR